MRIALISNHPAPYRDPFLARMQRNTEFDVDIFNELPMDGGHAFWNLEENGYEVTDLSAAGDGMLVRLFRLLKTFVFGPYDFVLWPGFVHAEVTMVALLRALVGGRYGFVADTVSRRNACGVRRLVKKLVVNRASLIFVPGAAGAAFFRAEYGVPASKIVKGAYALDGCKLEREIGELKMKRDQIRRRCGLAAEDVVFLMVANMTPARRYPVTAEAFVRFASGRPGLKLMIVGEGPDLPRMRDYARAHPEIVVSGGVSFQEMLSLYAMADVYVHGGCEPASTALVIGAIAKLPLVSTKRVGCSFDVLRDGKSGVEAGEPTDVESLARAFGRMASMRSRWADMGNEARELSKALDVEQTVAAFCKVMRKL